MDDGRGKKTFLQDRYENNIRIYLLCKEKIVYYHQEVNMKVIFNHKVHDYPKRHGDLKLAWYGNGNFCIVIKRILGASRQPDFRFSALYATTQTG